MSKNAEEGVIIVQLPEPCDKKSEAYKAGYKNICEIGKERIHRAGEQIRDKELEGKNGSNHSSRGIGFRDSSFANRPAKINVFEIFKLYMPEDADAISKRYE